MALVAVANDIHGHRHGFFFVVVPALTGSLVLLVMALLANNLHPRCDEVVF